MHQDKPAPADICRAMAENPKTRARDLAHKLGISEADLVAAQVGNGATHIAAHPDRIMPLLAPLGEVMALTRNASCVHEKVGVYENYHPGEHAAMVLTHEIDLRIFPSHWCHAFAVETPLENGTRRSVQVFDAAGDAIHKMFLRDGSELAAWDRLKAELSTGSDAQMLDLSPRVPPEAPKSRADKLDVLHAEWDRLTDTHQFLRLCAKLKMNRLGAYRIAGAPYVRPLTLDAPDRMLEGVRDTGLHMMFFVGNRGCIQIHNGPVTNLREMGPWQNVLDPGFDMHLRRDHIAEVWAVNKPTQRGMVRSVEAFDADGSLIFQAFPVAKDGNDHRETWQGVFDALPALEEKAAQ
ncbi:MAG: ChuX/HutX family heme-like substrate-binding protein [Pseudomonadota bacterium]